MGENEAACEFSREALRVAGDVGDRCAQAYVLTTLGNALTELDAADGAAEAYHKSLEIQQDLDQKN